MIAVQAAETFSGSNAADDWVRLFILFVGTTLALCCVRFAYLAIRKGEWYRVAGILSFGCIVATPAASGYDRFGEPLNWLSSTFYVVGLLLGIVALYSNYHFAPDWARLGGRGRHQKGQRA